MSFVIVDNCWNSSPGTRPRAFFAILVKDRAENPSFEIGSYQYAGVPRVRGTNMFLPDPTKGNSYFDANKATQNVHTRFVSLSMKTRTPQILLLSLELKHQMDWFPEVRFSNLEGRTLGKDWDDRFRLCAPKDWADYGRSIFTPDLLQLLADAKMPIQAELNKETLTFYTAENVMNSVDKEFLIRMLQIKELLQPFLAE